MTRVDKKTQRYLSLAIAGVVVASALYVVPQQLSLQMQSAYAAGALTNVRAVPGNNVFGATAFWNISFRTGTVGSIAKIDMTFPAGFDVSATRLIQSSGIDDGTISVSGQTVSYNINSPHNVAAGTLVRIMLSGIINAFNNSPYQINVTTKTSGGSIIDGPTGSNTSVAPALTSVSTSMLQSGINLKGKTTFGGPNALFNNGPTTTTVAATDVAMLIPTYTGQQDSDLRLYIIDDSNDQFSIWGNSCGGGDCADLNMASLAHQFMANGDEYHKGTNYIHQTASGNPKKMLFAGSPNSQSDGLYYDQQNGIFRFSTSFDSPNGMTVDPGTGWLYANTVQGNNVYSYGTMNANSISASSMYTNYLSVNGKLDAWYGVDPPYVSYSGETHDTIREFAKDVRDHEEVMLFWNTELKQMEVYVIAEDRFYTVDGKPVT